MKACRTGIEFHEYDSVPVLLCALQKEKQISLDISFPNPYNYKIRKYTVPYHNKKKDFDGDSRTMGNPKRAGEGGSLAKVAWV